MKLIILLTMSLATNLVIASTKNKEEKLPKVYTEQIKQKEIAESTNYLGKVLPAKIVRIYSPVEGIITKMNVKAGDKVKKDQVLAEIQQNVVGLKILPVKIRSTIDGQLYTPLFFENALINKNNQMFTIFNPNSYKLVINLSPDDAKFVTPLQEINIETEEGKAKGKIVSIAPDIDIITGTRAAEIEISNSDNLKLRPGMLIKANFSYNKRLAFVLDKNILKKREDKYYLQLLGKENKISELEVSLGSTIKNNVEVISQNLKDGTSIIVKSSVEPLFNDQKVEVMDKEDNKKNDQTDKKQS